LQLVRRLQRRIGAALLSLALLDLGDWLLATQPVQVPAGSIVLAIYRYVLQVAPFRDWGSLAARRAGVRPLCVH
jgi:hypothetical protein